MACCCPDMDKVGKYKREVGLVRSSFRGLQYPRTFLESEARDRRPQTKLPEDRKPAVPFVCTPQAQARSLSK